MSTGLNELIAAKSVATIAYWESRSQQQEASISPSEDVGLGDKPSDKDRRGFNLKRILIQSHILLIICKPHRGLLTNSCLEVTLGFFFTPRIIFTI